MSSAEGASGSKKKSMKAGTKKVAKKETAKEVQIPAGKTATTPIMPTQDNTPAGKMKQAKSDSAAPKKAMKKVKPKKP